MCYNAPVSFTTFVIGIYIAYEIWVRNAKDAYNKNYDYWNALFVVSFISMQFAEGLAWLNYDIARYLIVYIVTLQPIIQSFGNAYFNGQKIFYIPVLIGILFILLIRVPENIGVGPNGHLDWSLRFDNIWSYSLYFIFYYGFMLIPLFWQIPITRFYPLIIYGVGTLLWTNYNYKATGEFSSMWCFLAIGYAILAFYLNRQVHSKGKRDSN